jgi:hypothetical protein
MELWLTLKKTVFIIYIFIYTLHADIEYNINNTNITQSIDNTSYNYNRLRVEVDFNRDNFFASLIGDGVNYLGSNYLNSIYFDYLKQTKSDTPFKTQTKFHKYNNGSFYSKIYRLYGGYEDEKSRIVIGLQNIQMGVGRIWRPTNLFNPPNIYAIEIDEVFGVGAINYIHHLNDMSNFRVVISQQKSHALKYATQYKTFLNFADLAINIIKSDKTKMVGYEVEGNLGDSGIEVRSEGAYIKNQLKTFFQGIIGADYGFKNGINIMGEFLYSSKTFSFTDVLLNFDSEIASNMNQSKWGIGATISYNFNLFLESSLLYIDNKNSRFISPSLTYTLNDFNSFTFGAMFEQKYKDSYYLKYNLSF